MKGRDEIYASLVEGFTTEKSEGADSEKGERFFGDVWTEGKNLGLL